MRDFDATPEPKGEVVGNPGYAFVIQKHAASHLHYDFRLEWEGVLKSWAVPKEPVMDPTIKRLAVETEDHPLAYKDFAGDIPKGHYGAGHVDIWDQGIWQPLIPPDEGFKKGKLTFRLLGKRLSGEWTLVRTKKSANKPQWLLMKHKDKDNYQGAKAAVGHEPDNIAKPQLKAPEFHPALCQLVDEPPTGDGWIHETKYDGYRLIAVKHSDAGAVQLITRNQLDWSAKFPDLVKALNKIMKTGDVFDGEVVVQNSKGRSEFRLLQQAISHKDTAKAVFFVFDVLAHQFDDLRQESLHRRKEILDQISEKWPQKGRVKVSPWSEGGAETLYKNACRLGLEGLISKKSDAPYPVGRTRDWVKSKCHQSEEFLVIGYIEPEGSREYFGALLLAQRAKTGELIYRGKVGTGFNDEDSVSLFKRLSPLTVRDNPTDQPLPPISRNTKINWVKPELVVQIEYTEQTEVGVLRHPSFIAVREDKEPIEVKIEKPLTASKMTMDLEISSPEKIMYEKSQTTKQMVAEYYQKYAEWILPFVAKRPLSLKRCPDGAGRACFFQRNDHGSFSSGLHHKKLKDASIMWIEDLKGLLTLVQFGVLEIHTWGCGIRKIEKPNIIVFDLDPGEDTKFSELIEAAKNVRNLLSALDLQSFVKTSGKNGLHVCVPIEPVQSWEEVKLFAKQVALGLESHFPEKYTANVSKAQRRGKIFIDYLRNQRSSTFIAPYSTRIADIPSISMPIPWSLLSDKKLKNASEFTIDSKILSPDEAWPGFFEVEQTISKKLFDHLAEWTKVA